LKVTDVFVDWFTLLNFFQYCHDEPHELLSFEIIVCESIDLINMQSNFQNWILKRQLFSNPFVKLFQQRKHLLRHLILY
jgi:hypothetical protein